MDIIIHHSEIALKGKNASFFENKLFNNIREGFSRNKIEVVVRKDNKRMLCSLKSEDEDKIRELVKKIFGIKYFAFATILKKDIDELMKKAEELIKAYKKQGVKEIAIATKRADKQFPYDSLDINKKIGEIAKNNGIKINYKKYEKKIYIEITQKKIYVYSEKIKSNGGLPVGTSGKVLCLLSGGIDSPVAAWLSMKRGCKVDFLHFHTYRDNNEVMKTKIAEQVKILNEYQGESKLYLVPYHNYQIKTLDSKQNLDLVLFRNYMLRLAQLLTRRKGYKALVTGDSVGQVASQTLSNLRAASVEIDSLILRPLVTYTKEEIIDLAKKIESYKSSIKPYKDCCSIISRKPETHVKVSQIKKALENIDMDKIIDDSIDLMSVEKID